MNKSISFQKFRVALGFTPPEFALCVFHLALLETSFPSAREGNTSGENEFTVRRVGGYFICILSPATDIKGMDKQSLGENGGTIFVLVTVWNIRFGRGKQFMFNTKFEW